MWPEWTPEGLLPAGVWQASWEEAVSALGTTNRRQTLLWGLLEAMKALGSAGCSKLWLDGSFVTDAQAPRDYDACWDWQGVDRSMLDPVLIDYTPIGRARMKAKYLGDLFIAGTEGSSGKPFVEFFQRARDGATKGIVLLNPKEVA